MEEQVFALQRHAGADGFIRRFGMRGTPTSSRSARRLGWVAVVTLRADEHSRLARDRGHPPRARPLDAAVHHRSLPRRLRALLGRLPPRQPDDHRLRAVRRDRRVARRAAPRRHRHLRRRAVRRAPRPVARRAPDHRGGQAARRLHERRLGQAARSAGLDRRRARPLHDGLPQHRRLPPAGVGDGHYVNAARAIQRAGAWIVVQVLDVGDMVQRAPRPAARRVRPRLRGLRRAAAADAADGGARRRRLHAHEAPAGQHVRALHDGRVADDPLRRRRHGVLQRERDHGLGPARAAPPRVGSREAGGRDGRLPQPTRCCARSAASGRAR